MTTNNIWLVLPDQLFEELPNKIHQYQIDKIIVLDHYFYYDKYKFNQKKSLLHRASILYYIDFLKSKIAIPISYIQYKQKLTFIPLFEKEKFKRLHTYFIPNHYLLHNLKQTCNKNNIQLIMLDYIPTFMQKIPYLIKYFKSDKKIINNAFYIDQRKKFNILLTKKGKPIGDEWNLDKYNRPSFTKLKENPPNIKVSYNNQENKYIQNAIKFTKKHFNHHYGNSNTFIYPISHRQAKLWLDKFLKQRLQYFGHHQDHILKEEEFMFHSVLSSSLNIGLITDSEVINQALKYYKKVPLSSLEGFIRQILGWRSFMLGIYLVHGNNYKNDICIVPNKLRFTHQMPDSFYKGTTSIEIIDKTIQKAHQLNYLHHIERLMVIGNFMNLCEINPNDIFRWFSECVCIDGGSTDWVMFGNILMATFCDNGKLVASKPYISSYNYIKKVSDFKNTKDEKIWSALYWTFIDRNKSAFHGRGAIMKSYLKNKNIQKNMKKYKTIRKNFIVVNL